MIFPESDDELEYLVLYHHNYSDDDDRLGCIKINEKILNTYDELKEYSKGKITCQNTNM